MHVASLLQALRWSRRFSAALLFFLLQALLESKNVFLNFSSLFKNFHCNPYTLDPSKPDNGSRVSAPNVWDGVKIQRICCRVINNFYLNL